MTPEPRCYTIADVCRLVQIPIGSFYRLKQTGQLPYLEELLPRTGKRRRYRADLVDRYLAGAFRDARRRFRVV